MKLPLLLFNFVALSTCVEEYCSRSDSCWPTQSQWKDLGDSLKGTIHQLDKKKITKNVSNKAVILSTFRPQEMVFVCIIIIARNSFV